MSSDAASDAFPSADALSDSVLQKLAALPGVENIVLGGYFALRRFVDYRTTHDIDAWWRARSDPAAEASIRLAMLEIAAANALSLSERRFGETASFELHRGHIKVFSFQISVRSIELETPGPSRWPPILIETLADNVASKMNALVNRGSPRDFLDIYYLVRKPVLSMSECWKLWSQKNPGAQLESGKQKAMLHLMSLEQRRPLDRITDPAERERAAALRAFFREAFVAS